MLVENEDVISFSPGSITKGHKVLGRIVVHDRVQVEARVLPRYFNHSSFASLRRQLNYFAFVRLGKGRQRESSYTNEHVVVLEDILHLKRRPNTGKARAAKKGATKHTVDEDSFDDNATAQSNTWVSVGSSTVATAPPILNVSHPRNGPLLQRQNNRSRIYSKSVITTSISPRSLSPLDHNFISEDEHYGHASENNKQYTIALDLTRPAPDKDVLECCHDLLQLASSKGWD